MTDDLLRGNDQVQADNERTADDTPLYAGDAAQATGQAEAPLVVSRPTPGQTVVLDPSPDQTIVLNFDPANAQVRVEDGNLILGFDDNGDGAVDSRIVFLDLAAQDGEQASFQIGGATIDSGVLVSQALALSGQSDAPLEEVAAGPGAQGGGASAYSDNLGSILDLLIAQGVIPPTALEFRLIELEDEITVLDPAEGEITLTFRTDVDGGEGGTTSFEGGFEDWQPNQDDCDSPSFPMQVLIVFTPDDNEVLESFTLSGIPAGAVLYVGGTDAGNIVDTSGGTSPLLTPADLASGIFLLPPPDSGDDIPLTVTATISDPDSGDTSIISGTATAIIDSVADNPTALFDGQIIDGGEGCSADGGEGANQEEIESFLGIYGDLDDAANDGYGGNGEEDATDGAAIKTTLDLEAGDHVEMTFNFLDAEGNGPGDSFEDFAFVTVNGVVYRIANVGDSNDPTSASYVNGPFSISWDEESGYFTLSGTVEVGGTYVLGIGVMNEGDTSVDSGLLVDNLIVTRGEDTVFQDDFTSFDNWEILDGGFVAIVGDVNTNEDMPGAPTQGLLIATGSFDPSACGCEVIVSKLTYNEDNGTPVDDDIISPLAVIEQPDGGEGCQDCPDDEEPIFGAGFEAAVTDSDGSESLTKIVISTFAELEPGGSDYGGLEVALSGADDAAATNFMVGDQVLVHGETVDVVATFADGSTGLATADIEIVNGQLTLTFAPELRVQSVDLRSGSETPFQVRLPQHSDDDFELNLEVTATEFDIDGELTLDNNEATHQAVLQVEVKAVADGAEIATPAEPLIFAEDDESDPANHGEDSGETGLLIPLSTLGAALIDKDGSEAITEIKIRLEGADDGAAFVAANGDPLGPTLQIEVAEGVFITADVDIYGDCLELSFGEEAAGYNIDLSNLIAVQLPVDDSDDFTVHVAATTTEVRPEGDVACESETTHESFEVHVGGVAGPAAIGFGSYDNFPGCSDPVVDGNTLTLSVFEDNAGSVEGQDGAGPLQLPVFFTASTQDNDGSEKITKVTLSLEGAAEGTAFVDGAGDPLFAGQVIAGGTVSFVDGDLVITFPGDGLDSIDLSAIGVKLPQDSDDDFSIQIKTTTTEYDDDGVGALVDSYDTDATINVKVDAVADPVTVEIDAVSQSGDEAFAPGEAGSVTVDATFGDSSDGSEVHTVSVKVPFGFTVTDLAGGTLDGDIISWTVTGGSFHAVLGVEASDDLTVDETVKWKAKAEAVEQNENTDPALGDAECTTDNNTDVAYDKDRVTLDPALPPEVSVSLQGEPLCIQEDGQGQFQVTATAQGDDFVSQIKVENLPTGWTVSIVGSDAGDGGSFNPVTGIYTTGGNPAAVTLTVMLTPPADSDVDVATLMTADITFTATAEDPDSGDTADADPVVADVNVDAVADAVTVEITVNDSAVDTGNQFSPGETGSVRVQATFGDAADGSETHTVTVDIPAGFTVGDLTGLPAGVTAEENLDGDVVFTLGANVTALDYTFQVTAPAEGIDDNDIFSFSAKAVAEETPDDAECNLGNNVADDDDLALMYGEIAGEPEVGLQVRGESGVKEDQQTDVQITADVTTVGDTLTQVVVTAPAGWVLNAAVAGDIAGVAGDGTNSLTLTLNPGVTNFSEIIQATPPADTDVDAQFTVTATAVDGLDSTDGSDDFPVIVDAILDDGLDLGADGTNSGVEAVGAQTFSLNLDSSAVNPFPGSGDGGVDGDGSESTTVTLQLDSPLPAGVVLSTTAVGATITDNGGGSYTITGTNLEAAIDGLQVQVPGGFEGTISGTVSTESREANTPAGTVGGSGLEPDETDNIWTDSVDFSVTVRGGEVEPEAAIGLPDAVAAIKEDSVDNVVEFSANSGDATDELTTVVIELPNVATGDVDITQINTDLGGNGSAVLSQNGATAVITITFVDASNVTNFASSFTLDAPDEDSDVDLTGVKITANAKDITDGTTGSGDATTTIVVDAVLDRDLELGANGVTGGSESAAAQTIGLGLDSTLGSAGFALSLAGGADADGTESTTVTLTLDAALPAGAVLSSAAAGASVVGGPLVYTISGPDLEAAVDGLQVQVPGGYEGVISGTVTTESREANTPVGTLPASGGEPDTSDNVTTDSVTFTVTVNPTVTLPEVVVDLEGNAACIEEDGSVEFDITVSTDTNTDDVVNTVTFNQFKALADAGWTVDIDDNGAPGTFDANFNYSATGNDQEIVFTVSLTPPADSDLDVMTVLGNDLSVSATARDGSFPALVSAASPAVVIDINVDANADAGPGATGGTDDGDADVLSVEILSIADSNDGDTTFGAGESGIVTVRATFDDYTDGSETHTVSVAIPAGFSFTVPDPGDLPAGVTYDAPNSTADTAVFQVETIDGPGSVDIALEVTNDSAADGAAQFTATATASETSTGDVECDPSAGDNTSTVSDSDSAEVAAAPVLVVGENVSDVPGQTVDHRIENPDTQPDGAIIGNGTNDALIGDVGGANLVGKVVNIALVLDASWSMGTNITYNGDTMSRSAALNLAVDKLIEDLGDVAGATIRVHMTVFGTGILREGTFDLRVGGALNQAGVDAAKDFNVGTSGTQYTNYEAGLQGALNWFQNGNPHTGSGVVNQTIFMSDGAPTAAFTGNTINLNPGTNPSGVTTYGTSGDIQALNHVLGTGVNGDTNNEFTALNAIAPISTIGLAIGDPTHLGWLGQIDDDGVADNVTTGEGLEEIFGDIAQVNALSSVGSDSIEGGAGGDLMVGDTVFTDLLADAQGVVLPDGSGWEVIQYLAANTNFFDGFAGDTTYEKIISFLRDPAAQQTYDLFRESVDEQGNGRAGGHDTINGGDGNDSIYGQEGTDLIDGGDGEDVITGGTGDDTMTGGADRDVFRWSAADHGTAGSAGGTTVYNFAGVTQATNNHFAWELEIETSGNPANDGDWNSPTSHDELEAINELSNGDYEDIDAIDGDDFETLDPNAGGDVAAFVAQFTINEDFGDITQLDLMIRGHQEGGDPDADAYFMIWNYDDNEWDLLENEEQNQYGEYNYTGTIGSNFDAYLGGAGNDEISIMLYNADDEDSLTIDYVEVEVTSAASAADVETDTIMDFYFNNLVNDPDEDVLNLDDLLPASVDGSTTAAELTEYLSFSYDGTDTTVHVDHDGGGSFQATLDIVLENSDLGSLGTDEQIIQAMINGGNLVV